MANKKVVDRIRDSGVQLLEVASTFPNGFSAALVLPLLKARDARFTEVIAKQTIARLTKAGKVVRIGHGQYEVVVIRAPQYAPALSPIADPMDVDEQILNQALAAILELTKLIHRFKHRNRNVIAMLQSYASPVSTPPAKKGK